MVHATLPLQKYTIKQKKLALEQAPIMMTIAHALVVDALDA